ncbi:MAG: hypothetical protein M3Q07_19710, partial [Pseudobdellovibrionaceae bacterium]|nr:hypothetical protein [Pseudobdellovibrionaceae bacterium]
IYDLFYSAEANVWLPRLRARLQSSSARNDPNKPKTFTISESFLPLRKGQAYWIQNSGGVGMRQDAYTSLLSKKLQGFSAISFLDRLIFDSLESNFVSFRYGQSLLKGSSILTEAELLALLVEIRSGPLAGLRTYYDFTPNMEREGVGGIEKFHLRRASLGWAFGWDAPARVNLFFSQVNIQPKIGLLDLESRFEVENLDGQLTYLDFTAKNVYDLSIEIGIEKELTWFRSRLWGSINSTKLGISKQDAVSALSQKFGLDAYFDFMGGKRDWDVKLLLFGMAENLSLGKNQADILKDEDQGLQEISFNLFFLGGGFTLSW